MTHTGVTVGPQAMIVRKMAPEKHADKMMIVELYVQHIAASRTFRLKDDYF